MMKYENVILVVCIIIVVGIGFIYLSNYVLNPIEENITQCQNITIERNFTVYETITPDCPVCRECQKIKDLEPDQDRIIGLIRDLKFCEYQKQTCYNSNVTKNVTRLLDELNNCELILNKTRNIINEE